MADDDGGMIPFEVSLTDAEPMAGLAGPGVDVESFGFSFDVVGVPWMPKGMALIGPTDMMHALADQIGRPTIEIDVDEISGTIVGRQVWAMVPGMGVLTEAVVDDVSMEPFSLHLSMHAFVGFDPEERVEIEVHNPQEDEDAQAK